jgi:hypothetical protein
MTSRPSNDLLIQQLQLLLTGYGYNFYNQANQARADDLLVRERASYFLAHAVERLAQIRGEYFTRFVPTPTRDNPYPPAEALAQLRAIESVQQSIAALESHIRGMSVPTQDRIWWRFRQEQALLQQLLTFDLTLIRSSETIYQSVEQITAESWNSQGSSSLQPMIQQLTRSVQERERFLLVQV